MKINSFQPNLAGKSNQIESIQEKLASGKKINNAADNPAGLAIINRLTAELDAHMKGNQNAYDGLSLAQTADAAYENIGTAVEQIRELTIQAGSGILSDGDRSAIQGQIDQLVTEVNDTIGSSNFAGVELLNSNQNIEINMGNGSQVNIATQDAQTDLDGLGLNTLEVDTQANTSASLDKLDTISSYVNAARSELGASQNRLDAGVRNNQNQHINLAASRSRIQDADYAALTSQQTSASLLQQAQLSIQSQANLNQQQVLNLLS